MNALDALRKMVDHYPGGRAVVAARLGKTEEVLRKELSSATSHKLGVTDAQSIADMCVEAGSPHCHEYATAVATGSGGFVALAARESAVKQELRADMAAMLKECSDAVVVLTSSLADEVISDNELRQIGREVGEMLSKAQDVLRGARSNNEASKPAHLRAA